MTWTIRAGQRSDLPAIMNIVDGALLDIKVSLVKTQIRQGRVWVAVDNDRILGVIILTDHPSRRSQITGSEPYIAAVAVRNSRRNQGIGRALVTHGKPEDTPLAAEFHAAAKPFYEALDFTITQIDADRYSGFLDSIN